MKFHDRLNRSRSLFFIFRWIIYGIFSSQLLGQGIIADHTRTDITSLTESAINLAKATLHIGYGHTSHGSQITTGMTGLVGFANGGGKGMSYPTDIFVWNNGGAGGALDLEEGAAYREGWLEKDCGYYPTWVNETREYLNDPSHSDVNVIMWSWCGQVSTYTEQQIIDNYLNPMNQLEQDYPGVIFVYMTGHADGTGETGNLHLRNQQIKNYCINNNKVLFDFYDIECYDPDNTYFGDLNVTDNCDYTGGNWALEWQSSHTEGVDWYNCDSWHSQPLNANQKAYAAWWLWTTLASSMTGNEILIEAKVFLESTYDTVNDEMSTLLTAGGYIPDTSPYSEDPRQVTSVPVDVTDWILVQLRNTPDGSTVVTKSAFLHKDGRIVSDDGMTGQITLNTAIGDYYIVIKHRNHLAGMSSNTVSLTSGSSNLYDFTADSSRFHGAGGCQELESGVWGMISGDADGSGSVGASDRNIIWNDRSLFGYHTSDCDLNGSVGAADRNIAWNNRARSTNVPSQQ